MTWRSYTGQLAYKTERGIREVTQGLMALEIRIEPSKTNNIGDLYPNYNKENVS
jgi:hypothetical protein